MKSFQMTFDGELVTIHLLGTNVTLESNNFDQIIIMPDLGRWKMCLVSLQCSLSSHLELKTFLHFGHLYSHKSAMDSETGAFMSDSVKGHCSPFTSLLSLVGSCASILSFLAVHDLFILFPFEPMSLSATSI